MDRIWVCGFAALLLATAAVAAPPEKDRPPAKPGPEAKPAVKRAAPSKPLAVRVPAGGRCVAWIAEASAAPVPATGDRVTLDLDPSANTATVLVLDESTGYAARTSVNPGKPPAEVAFAAADFRLVHRLVIQVTGKEGRPLARGRVAVEDREGQREAKVLEPANGGHVEFADLATGAAKVTVVPEGGAATTKEVELAVPKGETSQTYAFAIPEATAVVDTSAAANAPAAAGPAAPPATPTQPPAAAAPAAPPAYPYPPPPRSDPTASFFQTVLGFAILAALVYAAIVYGRKQGWTIQGLLEKLGVRPDSGESAGAAAVAMPPAAPPPPVVADPSRCQFCGEVKDAAGNCACSLGAAAFATPSPVGSAGASASFASPFGTPSPATGAGPRLIGLSGLYMGHVFPIVGDGTIGREVTNTIALEQDTTVSRRHALVVPSNGGYLLQDQGSSNGTFVNGARVSESPLRPGDEVAIGGTRFRFEV
ncbi:MAG: FHA domain-containing protein [Armatimonadetes bacterium]|nr:FHA domain-containing protein [Armatimonadota bacterium]